jgi:hypothetical protein
MKAAGTPAKTARSPSETLRQGIVRYQNASGGVSTLTPGDIRSSIDPLGIGFNEAALDVLRSSRFRTPTRSARASTRAASASRRRSA